MASNQEKHDTIYHTLTRGEGGVKSAGEVFVAVTTAATDTAWLRDQLTGGEAGVRKAGGLISLLARIEANTAVTKELVGALKAVSGGQAFDEAKLLAGVQAAAEAGTAAAIKSIDTTVTFEKEG